MKVALYQHILKAYVWVSARTGEMSSKSSKLLWTELDTGMYSSLWTTILQASISSLNLMRYGCLQGCRSRQCSSPVYDPLCLWWQLWTLNFCELMIVFFKWIMLKDWKSFEKAVTYHHTYILLHILPALLVECHFENVYVCILYRRDLVILAQVPYNQKKNKKKCITVHGHRFKRQSNFFSVNSITWGTVEVTLQYEVIQQHEG